MGVTSLSRHAGDPRLRRHDPLDEYTEYLQRHGTDTKQVVVEGEAFTAPNVAQMRNRMLGDK